MAVPTGQEAPATQAPAPSPRPFITNPVPVGVAGFALTTFTLGLYTSGNLDIRGEIVVLVLALFYGGLTQFIAGWFALARGDLFPAAFMTTYGAFWFTYVGLVVFVVPRAGPAAAQATLIFLVMWTVITLIFTFATLGTNWTVFTAFVVFDIALFLLIAGTAGGFPTVLFAAGYAEMLLAAIAWYIIMAEIVNETIGRAILPLFPIARQGPPILPQPGQTR